jgi:hypothetical protein
MEVLRRVLEPCAQLGSGIRNNQSSQGVGGQSSLREVHGRIQYKREKHKLEEELQKAGKSVLNLSDCTDKTLLLASQLGKSWQEGDFETREKGKIYLLLILFPIGFLSSFDCSFSIPYQTFKTPSRSLCGKASSC